MKTKVFYQRADGYAQANNSFDKKYEHVSIVEKILGHALPSGAEVHHVNENKSDNRPENLVVCPSAKYHALLHTRMRALDAGYPAHYRKCYVCGEFDDPQSMYQKPRTAHIRHRTCKW